MSLKHFHVIFIVISVLLFIGVALWALVYTTETGIAVTAMGVGSAAIAVFLFGYGIYFIRKSRHIIT